MLRTTVFVMVRRNNAWLVCHRCGNNVFSATRPRMATTTVYDCASDACRFPGAVPRMTTFRTTNAARRRVRDTELARDLAYFSTAADRIVEYTPENEAFMRLGGEP